jgi:hypothetical protein
MSAAENPAQPPEDEYPESWLPWENRDQPRTLVGEILGYNLGPDMGWGQRWIATVQDCDQTAWSVWLSQKVLISEFEEQRPMPGEKVTIRYRGFQDQPKGGGPAYHGFRVTVDRGQQLPEFLTKPKDPLELAERSDIPTGLPPDPPDAQVVDSTAEDDESDLPWAAGNAAEGDDGKEDDDDAPPF